MHLHQARKNIAAELLQKGLLINEGLVGGRWICAASNKQFSVLDPAVAGEAASQAGVLEVHRVSDMGAEEAEMAVEAAALSFASWKGKHMQAR